MAKMIFFETNNLYFLGPVGTYAQAAMKKFLSVFSINSENIVPVNSISKILQIVDENSDSMAVVPIENSIEGIVRETVDNIVKLKDKDIQIIAKQLSS